GRRCTNIQPGPVSGGRSVGEAGLFNTGRYPMSAQTIKESRLVVIPATAMLACLDGHAGWRRHMLAFLSSRVHVLVRQIAHLKLLSASQRLGDFLLGLTERRSGPQVVRLTCEHKVIAGMLGMTPESLSRSLRQLRTFGVVSHSKHEILVEDVNQLRAFTAGEEL
ncbi:MAG: helix-turn-helix domain-containing protein, partial [Rhodospirillaceae bacterium]